MRVLYIKSAELIPYIPQTLVNMGYEVEVFEGDTASITISTDRLGEMLDVHLAGKPAGYYDFAISFNFFYIVSDICQKHALFYLSWIYDSPQAELYHRALHNPVNLIFVFDRSLLSRLRGLGRANLFYQPLAADTEGIAGLQITEEDMSKYGRQISFVGHMYEDNHYNRTVGSMPTEVRNQMQTYLTQQLCRWEIKRPWPVLSKQATEYYKTLSPEGARQAYRMPLEEYFGCILLSRKLAEMERLTAIQRLAAICPVTVFTNSRSDFLNMTEAEVLGPVDYSDQMRKVFHLSRINLNFTMPSIETGIPLRVMDIMSVGGFCLTNAQAEVEELFEVGKEIEVYHDLDELCGKCLYYLRHEDARLQIAMQGYQKVAGMYSYRRSLQNMIGELEKLRGGR